MRVYLVDLVGNLHDLCGQKRVFPLVHRDDSYSVSQNLARELRTDGSYGIVHESVRYEGGECAAVFRPRLLSNCRQERHLCYVWDGARIDMGVSEERLGELRVPPARARSGGLVDPLCDKAT